MATSPPGRVPVTVRSSFCSRLFTVKLTKPDEPVGKNKGMRKGISINLYVYNYFFEYVASISAKSIYSQDLIYIGREGRSLEMILSK